MVFLDEINRLLSLMWVGLTQSAEDLNRIKGLTSPWVRQNFVPACLPQDGDFWLLTFWLFFLLLVSKWCVSAPGTQALELSCVFRLPVDPAELGTQPPPQRWASPSYKFYFAAESKCLSNFNLLHLLCSVLQLGWTHEAPWPATNSALTPKVLLHPHLPWQLLLTQNSTSEGWVSLLTSVIPAMQES
jgi:hypothetical protein